MEAFQHFDWETAHTHRGQGGGERFEAYLWGGVCGCLFVCAYSKMCVYSFFLGTACCVLIFSDFSRLIFFIVFKLCGTSGYGSFNDERGSKSERDQANVSRWTVRPIHFHYAEGPSPKSFVIYPVYKSAQHLITQQLHNSAGM